MSALDAIADWPVTSAAAAVVVPSGVVAEYGDTSQRFALASVTKPLAARAAQIAIEEGVVELGHRGGSAGFHARGTCSRTRRVLDALAGADVAKPGQRRVTPTTDFGVRAETIEQAGPSNSASYLAEAVFEPLGMTFRELEERRGGGRFRRDVDRRGPDGLRSDLLRPTLVSAEMHADATDVQFPGLTGCCRGSGCSGPTTGGWGSRSGMPSRHTGPDRPTRAAPTGISASQGRFCGSIRTPIWRSWC